MCVCKYEFATIPVCILSVYENLIRCLIVHIFSFCLGLSVCVRVFVYEKKMCVRVFV